MDHLRVVKNEFRYSSRAEYERELEVHAELMDGGGTNEESYDELLDEYIKFCEENA